MNIHLLLQVQQVGIETDQKPLFPIRHHRFVSLWRNKQSVLFKLKSDLASLFRLSADLSSCPLTLCWMDEISVSTMESLLLFHHSDILQCHLGHLD